MTSERGTHTSDIADSIRRVSAVFERDFVALARAEGLTDLRALTVVETIGAGPERSQLLIARELGIDKTTLVAIIDTLVSSGFVTRALSSSDRRVRIPTLTTKGHRMLVRTRRRRGELTAERCRKLSAAQMNDLLQALHAIDQDIPAARR